MRAVASMMTHIERDRYYLPHLEIRGATYFITLRLADTLPALVLHEIRMELLKLKRNYADRNSEEFDRLVRYTLDNPVKAKLCKTWNEWPWTICSESIACSYGTR